MASIPPALYSCLDGSPVSGTLPLNLQPSATVQLKFAEAFPYHTVIHTVGLGRSFIIGITNLKLQYQQRDCDRQDRAATRRRIFVWRLVWRQARCALNPLSQPTNGFARVYNAKFNVPLPRSVTLSAVPCAGMMLQCQVFTMLMNNSICFIWLGSFCLR